MDQQIVQSFRVLSFLLKERRQIAGIHAVLRAVELFVVKRKIKIQDQVQVGLRLVGDLRIAVEPESRERRDSLLIDMVDKLVVKCSSLAGLQLAVRLLDCSAKTLEQLVSARPIRRALGVLEIVQLVIVERQDALQQVLAGSDRILEVLLETRAYVVVQRIANVHNFLHPLLDLLCFLLQSGLADVLVVQVLGVNSHDESVAGEKSAEKSGINSRTLLISHRVNHTV